MNGNIQILDVDDKENGVKIKYLLDGDTCTMNSAETPSDMFVDALDALKQDVLAMCELPAEYGMTVKVTGVKLARNEDKGNVKAHICGIKVLSGGTKLKLKTPTRFLETEKAGTVCFDKEIISRIYDLCKQAVLYVKGNRNHRAMFQQPELNLDAEASHTEFPKGSTPHKGAKKSATA